MTIDISTLSRDQKILLYTINIMNELVEKGLMTGGYKPTTIGKDVIEKLKLEKFGPTEEELRSATRFLINTK